MMATPTIRPLLAPLTDDGETIALIKLNTPVGNHIQSFRTLWRKAKLRAVVDGAVNELCKYHHADGRPEFLADLVTGDFDSAIPEVLDDYRERGVEIINTPDQNQTDFTKCFKIVLEKIVSQKLQVSCIVVFVSFNGRPDHIFGNMNTLYLAKQMTSLPVYLISGDALACLFSEGKHKFGTGTGLEEGMCGLIPLGQPAHCVSTTGLKWNLNNQRMEFGALVSTSNSIVEPVVSVKTDAALLWTMSIKCDHQRVKCDKDS